MQPVLKDSSLLKFQAYASECWVDAANGEVLEVSDPADGLLLGTIPSLSVDEVTQAITAAGRAMECWKREPAVVRAGVLRRWYNLVVTHTDDLAAILTAEQGKPLVEARGEIAYAASFIDWFASEALRIEGEIIPAPSRDQKILVLKEPVGLCAAITPWNFPSAMVTRKVAPALAAGCAIILKPASQTPFSALALAELALRAGLPPALFSVLTGRAPLIGSVLTASPAIRKLSFTGSTEVGKGLIRDSAATVKRLSMELGGNAPFVVFDDADLEAAVEGLMVSKFRGSGQTCVCANRVFVQSGIMEEFTRLLGEAIAKLKVGPGTEPGVTQGPLIDQAAVEKIELLIVDAEALGARVVLGGKRDALGGNFFEPTVLAECTPSMKIATAEIFGPVAALFSFEEEKEVIEVANATACGLASYFYSRDMARIWRVAEALEYGMIGINAGILSNAAAPFGGIKESGYGREGSRHGIDDYLALKYLCIAGLKEE